MNFLFIIGTEIAALFIASWIKDVYDEALIEYQEEKK